MKMTVTPTSQTLSGIVESKAIQDHAEATGNSVLSWCSSAWRPILAELVATLLLILFGCMTCIPIEGLPYQSSLYSPLGFGFIVSINVQIFGHLSGAHMNPSVSLAAVIWGSLSIPLAIGYVIAQCVGAILGFGILVALSPIDLTVDGICVNIPHASLNVLQVLGIEIALTTALNFLNCGVWDPVNKVKQDSVSLKFGMAIAGLSLAGGPLTGASMNPARTLGPAVWTGLWPMHWAYWVGPLIGGALAATIYKTIWYKTEEPKTE